MVDRGVYYTSGTSMHLYEEAGLQTLIASILVGCPALLGCGCGVRLTREAQLSGTRGMGPSKFMFHTRENAISAVVEVKTTRRLTMEYAKSVEQLYAELFAAWQHNAAIGKGRMPVAGMLVAAGGAIAFLMKPAATTSSQFVGSLVGSVECSDYMHILQGKPVMPGIHLGLWLHNVLAAALPECCSWGADEWAARTAACVREEAEWRRRFAAIADATQN